MMGVGVHLPVALAVPDIATLGVRLSGPLSIRER